MKKLCFWHLTIILSLCILGVSILSSCTTQKLVVADNDLHETEKPRSITRDSSGISITVTPSSWEREPLNLEHYVIPVLIEISNGSSQTAKISNQEIVLIADDRTQFNPIYPADVAATVLSDNFSRNVRLRHISYISFGFHRFYRFRPYPYHFHPFYYPDPFFFSDIEDTDEILTSALIPGNIRPGAVLKGYVYFRKIPKGIKSVVLEIKFLLQETANEVLVSFPFDVAEESILQ